MRCVINDNDNACMHIHHRPLSSGGTQHCQATDAGTLPTSWYAVGHYGDLARVSGCRAFSCTLGPPPSPYRTPLVHDDSAVAVLVVCSVSTLVLIVSRLRGQEASASSQNILLRAHQRVFTPDCTRLRALEGLLLKFFFRARLTRDAPFVCSRHALGLTLPTRSHPRRHAALLPDAHAEPVDGDVSEHRRLEIRPAHEQQRLRRQRLLPPVEPWTSWRVDAAAYLVAGVPRPDARGIATFPSFPL